MTMAYKVVWTTADCCQWEGIRCSNLTGHILMLDLHGEFHVEYEIVSHRYISGEIHKSLMELQQLKYLNLSLNSFSGGIPEFLGSLSNLRYLDLSSCGFVGKISSQYGSLSHLKYLNLAGNSLEGSIPRQLGNLSELQHLDLNDNYIEGNIPSQLGNLSKLQYLDLRYNSFEGNIPSQLGNLSNLQKLHLDDGNHAGDQWLSNLISLTHLYLGSISNFNSSHSWLQMIAKLPKLRELSLIECGLSDHFILSLRPSKFNSSTSLSVFDLSWNTFTSSMIFQWLSNITSNLVELDLTGNLLESSASNHFGVVMNSLERLDLSSNNFKGEALKSFVNICTLRSLNMYRNNLTEDLPSILHNLSNGCVRYSLQDLDLTYNQITGSLPDLLIFSSLKTLALDGNQLSGKIFEGIRLPSKLKLLYIRSNSLEGGVPKSFGSTCTLELLDLSDNKFSEELTVIFNHLSGCSRYSLQELDLRYNQIKGSLPDLSVFSSLETLVLDGNQLSGKLAEGIRLPSKLELLSISSNSIEGGVPKSFGSTCTLGSLDLSYNSLSEELSVIFNHLSGCSRYSLRELNLGGNKFNGILPDFTMFLKLERLDLSGNQLKIAVPKSFQNASILRSLDLSNNSLSENLPMIIHHLSRYARYSLQELDLSMNQINGTLPNLLSMFLPSLKMLDLSGNKLNGTISEDLRFPTELEVLYLMSNSLKGVMTDSHFTNMSRLKTLELSDNSLTLEFRQNWVPSFQLRNIGLRSCKLGPTFPKWLQTQNEIYDLDISNAGISDIVPKWLWAKLALREGIFMDISYNNLQGMVPNFPLKNIQYSLNLGSNQFEGPIPPSLRDFVFLDLSKNKFSDSFSFLCASGIVETLYQLDLSNNELSGQIPDCWSRFNSLTYLNLSHNEFSGMIPTSMGSLLELQVLLLRNNNLTGEIPFSLRNCTKLVMVDMAENRLFGPIPAWIGSKLQELQILSLGGNHFYGSLPLQICYLKSIQLLDLSLNNLSGQIPKCINNFTSMTQKISSRDYQGHWYFVHTGHISGNLSYDLNAFLMWKGSERMFKNNGLSLLKSIDVSSNHFSEEIPIEIENLFELVSLNLSRNNLTGEIPSNIGRLTSLDSLDLSRNQFVGSIPLSLTQIDRLAVLDLSHNHLSGEIPTGTQLQSFNASSYEDNLDLCGPPLKKLCIDGEPTQEPIVKLHEDDYLTFTREFYMSMAIGFVISFWGVFGSILIKRSWRHAYFRLLSHFSDAIYFMVAEKAFNWWHRR